MRTAASNHLASNLAATPTAAGAEVIAVHFLFETTTSQSSASATVPRPEAPNLDTTQSQHSQHITVTAQSAQSQSQPQSRHAASGLKPQIWTQQGRTYANQHKVSSSVLETTRHGTVVPALVKKDGPN